MKRNRGRIPLLRALGDATSTRVAAILVAAWNAMACGGETDGSLPDSAATNSRVSPTASSTSESSTSETPLAEEAGAGTSGSPEAPGDTAGADPVSLPDNTGGTTAVTVPDNIGGTAAVTVPDNTGGTAAVTVPDNTQPPERLAALAGDPAFLGFKDLWQRLDELPRDPGGGASVEQDAAAALTEELVSRMQDLRETELLTDDELLFLEQLALARIELLASGSALWMLHRSYVLFEQGAFESVEQLESKLDVLEGLRDQCHIEPEAYQTALLQVEREAISAHALRSVMVGAWRNAQEPQLEEDGVELVVALEDYVESIRATADDTVVATLTAQLATVRAAMATIPFLVRFLEACE